MTDQRTIGGRYEIEREIGRGGMGQVYRARDTRLGRTVAIKMLPAEMTHDTELRRRLAQEARAASALTHPGVATVYDYEEYEGKSFIVFEYVEGATLRERMKVHRFSTDDVLDLGIQLADALAAAQERGVVHRDLKPENIMVTPGPERVGRTKILDFGLAKVFKPIASPADGQSDAKTATVATTRGLVVGTVNYMSPEQVEGEPADARSDIYALGLVLYEMATGTNPFVGKTPTSTIANILKQDAPPVSQRSPAAPAELDRIVRKCLRKVPEERFQSARELRVDLANLRRDSASHPTATTPTSATVVLPSSAASGLFAPQVARTIFLVTQMGYLVMYGFFFYDLGTRQDMFPSAEMLLTHMQAGWLVAVLILVAVAGTPVRLYLLSATAANYVDTGRKFRLLFPLVLLLDVIWSLSPALMTYVLGALAFPCIAALLYLPFAQRRLLYDAYSPQGGRISGIRPTGPS